jgi:hypothetical protein
MAVFRVGFPPSGGALEPKTTFLRRLLEFYNQKNIIQYICDFNLY